MNKKTRTHRLSKLPDDGEPWAPNNLLTPEQKKNTNWTPVKFSSHQPLWPQSIIDPPPPIIQESNYYDSEKLSS